MIAVHTQLIPLWIVHRLTNAIAIQIASIAKGCGVLIDCTITMTKRAEMLLRFNFRSSSNWGIGAGFGIPFFLSAISSWTFEPWIYSTMLTKSSIEVVMMIPRKESNNSENHQAVDLGSIACLIRVCVDCVFRFVVDWATYVQVVVVSCPPLNRNHHTRKAAAAVEFRQTITPRLALNWNCPGWMLTGLMIMWITSIIIVVVTTMIYEFIFWTNQTSDTF